MKFINPKNRPWLHKWFHPEAPHNFRATLRKPFPATPTRTRLERRTSCRANDRCASASNRPRRRPPIRRIAKTWGKNRFNCRYKPYMSASEDYLFVYSFSYLRCYENYWINLLLF
jgi:hypothetical protein